MIAPVRFYGGVNPTRNAPLFLVVRGRTVEHVTVVVQRLTDGLFLDGVGSWGPKEEAYDFGRVGYAAEFCVARPLEDVRILVDSDDLDRPVALEVKRGTDEALQTRGQGTRVFDSISFKKCR